MNPANILICTAAMWLLEIVLVVPLANAWLAGRVRRCSLALSTVAGGAEAVPGDQAAMQRWATAYYIAADFLVLGLAGLIGGLLGWQFIGFAWKAKAWPGLLAFCGASALGMVIVTPGRVW